MTRIGSFFVTTLLIVLLSVPALGQGSSIPKSKWGADDQLGSVNMLTPAMAKQAASLVRTGKVYALGIITAPDTPAFPPRTYGITIVQPGQQIGKVVFPNGMTYNDDIIHTWVGIGSQIDGLGHVGLRHEYYNQHRASDFAGVTGLGKLGLEHVPPIVTRGVLVNMAKYFGVETMKEGQAFNSKEIKEAARQQGVTIRKGDVVLFHTGWLNLLGKNNELFGSQEPGLGAEGGRYLAKLDVVAVGADTWGLDVVPPEQPDTIFQNHLTLLAENGIYILENMDTRELAKDGATEFMFVLGHARMAGTVQMIINPVAIR